VGATAKNITVSMAPKTDKFAYDSRANVAVDSMRGVVLLLSADWIGYAWSGNYLCQWALANC
jgi:hypothetical protein